MKILNLQLKYKNKKLDEARYGRDFAIEDSVTPALSEVCDIADMNPEFFQKVFELNLKHRHSLRRVGITTNQKELVKQYSLGAVHADR